jgi:hypothetical protein
MDMYFGDEPAVDTAQICLNGHVTNDSAIWSPQFNQNFCAKCGEPTTTSCPSCKSAIPGRLLGPSVVHVHFSAPSYCSNCGHAYPWTERRLKAAKQLADEFDELDEADRNTLKASIDDLAEDSPAAEVSGRRFKKIAAKLGKESAGAIKSVITDVLRETAKKILFS